MDPLQWVALGFVAALIVFLMLAYFTPERQGTGQGQILRFLCCLCAGFAGGLFTGDALFKLDTEIGDATKLAISGTTGFAFAFAIWFTWRWGFPLPSSVPPAPAINISIPDGWNFKKAVEALVDNDHALVDFVGFKPEELAAPLQRKELHYNTVEEALLALRFVAASSAIRPYDVKIEPSLYRLTVRS